MLQQCFNLGGKREHITGLIIVQRFLTDTVAEKKQLPLLLVYYTDGKHPFQSFYHFYTPLNECLQYNFGVGMCAKVYLALGKQRRPHLLKIIDLAIKYHNIPAVGRVERLVGCGTQVDYAEARVAYTEHAVYIDTVGIRSTVGNGRCHRAQNIFINPSLRYTPAMPHIITANLDC